MPMLMKTQRQQVCCCFDTARVLPDVYDCGKPKVLPKVLESAILPCTLLRQSYAVTQVLAVVVTLESQRHTRPASSASVFCLRSPHLVHVYIEKHVGTYGRYAGHQDSQFGSVCFGNFFWPCSSQWFAGLACTVLHGLKWTHSSMAAFTAFRDMLDEHEPDCLHRFCSHGSSRNLPMAQHLQLSRRGCIRFVFWVW